MARNEEKRDKEATEPAQAEQVSTEPATAEGPTVVAETANEVLETAQARGYWGEKRANANAAPRMPAHGDGDLSQGDNRAAEFKPGPDTVTPGDEVEGAALSPDPANAEQYGNGPAPQA